MNSGLKPDDLLVGVADGIGTLTLNRPDTRNAVDPEYLERLIVSVEALDADPEVRVLVLRGAGKSFSAGGSMAFLRALPQMDTDTIRRNVYDRFQGITRALVHCSKPVIASLHGAVVGAACEMAAACDMRLAADDAFFCENWVDLGLMPPLGGLFLLPRFIGLGRATEMVMTGERIGAVEACKIGLVNRVVPLAELEAETKRMAALLASKSPNALRVIKQALRRGQGSTISAEWEFNVYAQIGLIRGPDFKRFTDGLPGPKHKDATQNS
jgi:enoyl-CoA hydratase/carnithine racemase